MKKMFKLIGIIILITIAYTETVHARLSGSWVSSDRQIRMDIEYCDVGIRVNEQNRGWKEYRKVGNRFQSTYGSFCRAIDDRSIEWYDRRSRNRYILYREDRYDRDRYDYDREVRRDRYGYDLRNLEGRWYNESTGRHIQVKARRGRIRVKFQGERWIDFVRGRNGSFVDEYGNYWRIHPNHMTFESFNRDLVMKFHKGTYRGRAHDCYFDF